MTSQDDSSTSSREDSECPMCLEELDLTDLNFKPCSCGYQMCRFCWHRINSDLDGKCPHCRKPYDPEDYTFTPPDPEEIEKMKKEKKQKEKSKKSSTNSRKHLTNVRVIQRNLVYVTNVPLNVAKEDFLKKHFTQYGKIIKVVVNRHVYNADSPSGPSVSCYITYYSKDDAFKAIQAVNGATLWGKQLRASFGTTKYCTYFLKFLPCPNPECMYLHELGGNKDSFTKEEMNMGKHLTAEAMQILSQKNAQANGTNSVALKSSTGSLSKSSDIIVEKPPSQSSQAPIGTPSRLSEPKGWNISNTSAKAKRELDNNEWPTAQSAVEVKVTVSSSQEKTSALPATASWGKPPSNAWASKKLTSSEGITKSEESTSVPTPSTSSLSSSSPNFLQTSQEIAKPTSSTKGDQKSSNASSKNGTRSEAPWKEGVGNGQYFSSSPSDDSEETNTSSFKITDEQFQFQQEEEEEEERDRQYQQQQWANNHQKTQNAHPSPPSADQSNSWKNGSSIITQPNSQPNVNSVNSHPPSPSIDPELATEETENWNDISAALGIVELVLSDKPEDQRQPELNSTPNNWNTAQQKQRPSQSRFNFAQETETQDQANQFEESFFQNNSNRRPNEGNYNTYQPFRNDSSFGLGMDSFQQPVDWFKSFLPHVNVSIGNPTNPSNATNNNTNNANTNKESMLGNPLGMRPYPSIQLQQQMHQQQMHQQQLHQQQLHQQQLHQQQMHQQQLQHQQLQHQQLHQQQLHQQQMQHQHQHPQQQHPQQQHPQQQHSIQNADGSVYHRSQFPQFQQPTIFNTSPFNPYGFPANNPNFQMVDPAILGTGNIYMNSPWGVPNQSNQTQTMNNPFQTPNTMYNMNNYSLYGNTFVNPPFASHPTAQHSVINSESSSVRFSKSQS